MANAERFAGQAIPDRKHNAAMSNVLLSIQRQVVAVFALVLMLLFLRKHASSFCRHVDSWNKCPAVNFVGAFRLMPRIT